MTVQSWSSPIAHTTDTEFRSWGKEISDYLQAAGCIQTSDTGQINWATATRPAINTTSGYEVYALGDSLSTTTPIYFKLYYGTASNAVWPRLMLCVGAGSSGSGNLTGLGASLTYCIAATTAVSNPGGVSSYICRNEGFVGYVGKCGAPTTSPDFGFFGFMLARSCNNLGQPTAHGLALHYHSGNSNPGSQGYSATRDLANGVILDNGNPNNNFMLPGRQTSTSYTANIQVFPAWFAFPQIQPCFAMAVGLNSELPRGTTASIQLVGSTARTFISLGMGPFGKLGARNSTADDSLCSLIMLWE